MWSVLKSATKLQVAPNYLKTKVRFLNLLEYQSKHLLKQNGIAIQDFCMVNELGRGELENFKADEYVVKAQILAGGRGKGHFDNGYKGGVQITKNRSDLPVILNKMLGHKLITKQTPKEGIQVKHIMIANSINIKRETYFCIVMDQLRNGPVVVVSPAGGVDIETVAEKDPQLIKTVPVDINNGLTYATAVELATFLQFKGDLKDKATEEIMKLWKLFVKIDAIQLEINPLVETDDGKVISVDAKLNFDDNAKYRQKEIFSLEDSSEIDPREVEASKYNLNYIGMNGNIGCLVNGAGLAMATMDLIKLYGGNPANFLDVGGGVNEKQVKAAFEILTSDKNVKSVLINVFGGIVNCTTIANGIVEACKSIKLQIPVIVRLEGTNAREARHILEESQLQIQTATRFEEAAEKAVNSVK